MGSLPRIPLVDVARQYAMVEEQAIQAVLGVLSSGRYILGGEVRAFEGEIADYLGVKYAVGVASGTDALFLTLRALGVGPGDEVVTTPFTFVATAEAVANLGAVPRFVDIEEDNFNIDPGKIAGALTDCTRAVIPVHLFGHPADIESCLRVCEDRGIPLVEDCAQCLGAEVTGKKAGSFGSAGALSFYPSKNLGAGGDAGMLVTGDEALAESARMLRDHGSAKKYYHEAVGINSRLDEVQAAFLRVKLERLAEWNGERAAVAAYYDSHLEGVVKPAVRTGFTHAYHQYTIRSERRDDLARRLEEAGIASAIYYRVPLHLQPCFAGLGYVKGDLPVAEKAAREALSLPIFPGMTAEEMERVCAAVNTG